MAVTIINFAYKTLLYNKSKTISLSKSIMTTSTRLVEKAIDELKDNPYFSKYAEKIADLQQTSPEEFLSRVEEREKAKDKTPSSTDTSAERPYSSLLKPKVDITNQAEEESQELSKIMKLELIQDKSADEIKRIWEEYHLKKDVIVATIPEKDFKVLQDNGRLYPTFLFPIPRSQGYEFIMCQFLKNVFHFTPLLYYQVHKENAPECLTMVHYTELQKSKGIVLMRGQYDKNIINSQEAQCLANQVQLYYGQNSPEKIALLEKFTKNPDGFKHMDLIRQIESLSL